MDLFNPTDHPQDLAVTRAIDQAVEMFIAGQYDEADHCFEMAQEFVRAPTELFVQPIDA
jgi:hypothetical protein